MLKIKLARFGKKKQPHYRVVVNEARDRRDGKYVAALGHYAPNQQPKMLEIDLDAYASWLKKGAQPTDTVANLVKRIESGNPFPAKKARLSKKAKAKAEAAQQEAASAATAEATPPETNTSETSAPTEDAPNGSDQ